MEGLILTLIKVFSTNELILIILIVIGFPIMGIVMIFKYLVEQFVLPIRGDIKRMNESLYTFELGMKGMQNILDKLYTSIGAFK